MVYEGFLMSLANALGIPLGTKIRKNYTDGKAGSDNEAHEVLDDPLIKDLINSIIDITKDDVCVGETPLFYQSQKKRLSSAMRERCDSVCKSFNRIASWVAFDLLKDGFSVYVYNITKSGELVFIPYLLPVSLYLRRDGTVMCVNEKGDEIENALLFVYYEKNSLEVIKDSDDETKGLPKGLLRIRPQGIQTKNILSAARQLIKCEADIQRLRTQTSKVIRFASVEVGLNKGDQQQHVLDDISEGLNANSGDLYTVNEFDDQIPVFPTRKGLGKPEFEEHFSQADLKQLADLDYYLSKLFLAMRFPKSYADFTTNLTQTAVSMIRGDIRYAKLLLTTRSLIETTFNDFMRGIDEIVKYQIEFRLTQVPSSEDDDFITTLGVYTDFAESAWGYISDVESLEEAKAKLLSLRELYASSTNSASIERWADAVLKIIEVKWKEPEPEPDYGDYGEDMGGGPREGLGGGLEPDEGFSMADLEGGGAGEEPAGGVEEGE